MDIAGLIVGAFVGGIGGMTLTSMLAAGKAADLEAEMLTYKHLLDKAHAELAAQHDAEKIHSDEVKRIGKMGKRQGAITGANA